MDTQRYRQYMQQYIQEAIQNSDGSNFGIYEQLDCMKVGGLLTRHREEKERALSDAKAAFDGHRHWPLKLVLSHLGVESLESEGN